MTVHGTRRRVALPIAVIVLFAAALPAGAEPPARNANVWNGHAHQPTREGVQRRERAAGVTLPPRQRAAKDAELDRLSHQLGGGHVRPPAAAQPAQEGQGSR